MSRHAARVQHLPAPRPMLTDPVLGLILDRFDQQDEAIGDVRQAVSELAKVSGRRLDEIETAHAVATALTADRETRQVRATDRRRWLINTAFTFAGALVCGGVIDLIRLATGH